MCTIVDSDRQAGGLDFPVEIDRHGGCWLWPSHALTDKDGRPRVKGRQGYRVVWEILIGTCPIGREPHHTCRNKLCVNPWHLQWLTHIEHARLHGDLRWAENTHCPSGHEYTPQNTYEYTRKDGRREKHCRRCRRDRWHEKHGKTQRRYQTKHSTPLAMVDNVC